MADGLRINLDAVSIDGARKAVADLLDGGVAFDGIMSTTDTMAAGAVIALREHGLSVPRDVLVTGFDDCQLAEACGPGLTSVHQDVAEMSRLATELLFQMMRGERPERSHYRLPVTGKRRLNGRRLWAAPVFCYAFVINPGNLHKMSKRLPIKSMKLIPRG